MAWIESIQPCPQITEGPGRVVLGTITHFNGYVVELTFEGTDQTLEPTFWHQLYSETHGNWIPAGHLEPGDTLRTTNGSLTVAKVRHVPGIHRVYNLEVAENHCYYVGKLEVLSHNANGCSAGKRGPNGDGPRRNSAGQPINEKGQFTSGAGGDSAAARGGRSAHDDFDDLASQKGWEVRPRIVDADGNVHIPDARDPKGRPIEYKPATGSGHKSGRRQISRYKRVTGKNGRVIYYDPVTGKILPFYPGS